MQSKHLIRFLIPFLSAMGLSSAFAADGTWNSTTSANWNVATDPPWAGGVTADGSGFTANFNTLNPTADVVVTLGVNRIIGNLVFGDTDTSTAAGWTVTGNTLTLAGTTPTVTVNALGTGKTVTLASAPAGSKWRIFDLTAGTVPATHELTLGAGVSSGV